MTRSQAPRRPADQRTPRASSDCEHRFITTYGTTGSDDSYEVSMWACQECSRHFYPACPTCIVNGHRSGTHEAEAAPAARAGEPGSPLASPLPHGFADRVGRRSRVR